MKSRWVDDRIVFDAISRYHAGNAPIRECETLTKISENRNVYSTSDEKLSQISMKKRITRCIRNTKIFYTIIMVYNKSGNQTLWWFLYTFLIAISRSAGRIDPFFVCAYMGTLDGACRSEIGQQLPPQSRSGLAPDLACIVKMKGRSPVARHGRRS